MSSLRKIANMRPERPVVSGYRPPTTKDVLTQPMDLTAKAGARVGRGGVGDIAQTHAMSNELNRIPEVEIVGLSIGLLSPAEIKKIKVIDITTTTNTGDQFTPNDGRLGSVGMNNSCQHCYQVNCPGHFGVVTFPCPVFNPLYVAKEKTVIHILSCICIECAKPYMSRAEIERKGLTSLQGLKRLAAIASESIDRRCRNVEVIDGEERTCTGRTPRLELSNSKQMRGLLTYAVDGEKEKHTMDAASVLKIFKQITDETAELIGFKDSSAPLRFIMESMLIPPIQTRAPEILKGVSRQNKMTALLTKIVQTNVELYNVIEKKKAKSSTSTSISEASGNLYDAILNFQDHVLKLIQGKKAIIRGGMIGKRGDFCGRAVLSPDDEIEFGQIVIPAKMVSSLTPMVHVTNDNIDSLQKLLEQGRITHITNNSGSLAGSTRQVLPGMKIKLEVGNTVYRWLKDGDWVVFDRQPTLHKQNIMAYRAVIGYNRSTIGVHLSVTHATNTDFDGDEGNIYLPQSEEAIRDASEKMYACRNIVSSQDNKPIVGPVYESITSPFVMTDPRVMVNFRLFEDAFFNYFKERQQIASLRERLAIFGIHPHSGVALFSSLLPEDFNYKKGNVVIIKGILIRGRITDKDISVKHRSIIQELHTQYGWQRTSNFITDATRLFRRFFDLYGHTVGYRHCRDSEEMKEAEKIATEAISQAEARNLSLGPPREDPVEEMEREKQIREIINSVGGVGAKIAKEVMSRDNPISIMSKDVGSGSKGATFNTANIYGNLDQQFYDGKRMGREISNNTRALPHLRPDDFSLYSQGFCYRGLSKGLKPVETFFHSKAGREGLTDKANKVPQIGELHRKVSKTLEDVQVGNFNEVVGTGRIITQYVYGGDGFDGATLLKVPTSSDENFASFIDLTSVARDINVSYGWAPITEEESLGDPRAIPEDHFWIGETGGRDEDDNRWPWAIPTFTEGEKITDFDKDVDYNFRSDFDESQNDTDEPGEMDDISDFL